MPALLTRMSILPKASSTALTSVSAPCCLLRVRLDGERAAAERLDLGGGRVRRRGVAAVAERDVGALAGESQHDGLADAPRAAGHEGGLAGQVEHVGESLQASRVGWWTRLGLARDDVREVELGGQRQRAGEDLRQRRRDRVHGSQSRGIADVTSSGRTALVGGAAARRIGGPLHGDRARREAGPERHEHDLVAERRQRPSFTASGRGPRQFAFSSATD